MVGFEIDALVVVLADRFTVPELCEGWAASPFKEKYLLALKAHAERTSYGDVVEAGMNGKEVDVGGVVSC